MQTQTSLRTTPEVPFVPWDEFIAAMNWQQGQHVTICAPTGWGKTTLELDLIERRVRESANGNFHAIILGTKPEDDTLEEFCEENGYKVFRSWPVPTLYKRICIWPKGHDKDAVVRQRPIFERVLNDVYRKGRYAVGVDELDYICNFLKLSPYVELIWRQGRSLRVSLVGGTQRPFNIPLLAYDQSSHLFVGWDNDETNLKRYAGFAGGGKPFQRWLADYLANLEEFHFVYLPRKGKKGGIIETKVEL